MKENQFLVDLGDLKLDDNQRAKINASIQKAVAGELAELNTSFARRSVFIPIRQWPDFPFPWGLIIRDFDKVINVDALNIKKIG